MTTDPNQLPTQAQLASEIEDAIHSTRAGDVPLALHIARKLCKWHPVAPSEANRVFAQEIQNEFRCFRESTQGRFEFLLARHVAEAVERETRELREACDQWHDVYCGLKKDLNEAFGDGWEEAEDYEYIGQILSLQEELAAKDARLLAAGKCITVKNSCIKEALNRDMEHFEMEKVLALTPQDFAEPVEKPGAPEAPPLIAANNFVQFR